MRKVVLILFTLISFLTKGQNKYLDVRGLKNSKFEASKFSSDVLQATQEARDILKAIQEQGYIASSLDSIAESNDSILLFFHEGNRFRWANISPGNLSTQEFEEIDINSRLYLRRPFSPNQLAKLFERCISYFENNGYPFVKVKLDSVVFDDENAISGKLHIEKNKYYTLDSVEIKGNGKINDTYLNQHLDLDIGNAYKDESIKNLSTRIQELPFIKESKRREVLFFEDYVKLILYLEKNQASRFDGVLGLLTDETDGSIELTGDVDLNLINAFNRGENLGLNWRKLKGNSQDLQIDFGLPYFLNTPIGIEANFKLFRRDTTFLDLISRIGASYALRRGEFIKLFFENKSSSLLSRDRFLNSTNNLPPFGDIRISQFGVGYRLQRLDYLFNPRKGLYIESAFAVGRKRLQKIRALEEEQPTIYDGINLNTIQYNGDFRFSFYQALGGRSTLLLANQSASTYSENLYENELLRIGGLKRLRGFDEESINVSTYSIFTLEYRFLLDRNSYFSLFTDGAYYEAQSINSYVSDTPLGIGAGISFETGAGIFTFNYAIGRQFNNPIDLRAAKIHFGFVNFF